ncbi:MAG: pentapeptide repeat-containing protein [Acidobacteria bacterium]|nr:pentapeptide repeat-containing protein [Acidobacteriota bacterium]
MKIVLPRKLVLPLAGVVAVSFLLAIIVYIPRYQANKAKERINHAIDELKPKERAKERLQLERDIAKIENDWTVTIAQIIGGIVLLLGLYFTYKNLRVTEEGKLTDRFSKAIELLGSKNMDVRLGAIYTLERIAKDSQKDHWTVMEVLTAFVRSHSPNNGNGSNDHITTDIQAILDIINRRGWTDYERDQTLLLDLRNTNLVGAYLVSANLDGANFFKADLSKATLYGATLVSANLLKANLLKADLIRADLRWAVLEEADLREANLGEATLNEAYFAGATLTNARYVTWEQIKVAQIDETTQLPPELQALWDQSRQAADKTATQAPIVEEAGQTDKKS